MDDLRAPAMLEVTTEHEARVELAWLYQIANVLGWTDILETHFSMRVPGEPDCFLFNPYDMLFDEITPECLIKVRLGEKSPLPPEILNPAGATIHGSIYQIRPDVNCIIHTHSRYGGAVSTLPDGLRPISQDAMHVWADLVYHAYGEPSTPEEYRALQESCTGGNCAVLRNHGLLTYGHGLPYAFKKMYMLERACEFEYLVRTMGTDPIEIDPHVVGRFRQFTQSERYIARYGQSEWAALKRVHAGLKIWAD